MQRLDPAKRQEILDAAARLFAARPFHEVRLDDVAAEARIGKGTIYLYFEDKEGLYLSLIREGMSRLVNAVEAQMENPCADVWDRLAAAVEGLIGFASRFPDLFRVMRSGALTADDPELQRSRRELSGLIERAIRDGNEAGQTADPWPELTTQFVLSFVRGAVLYPPEGLTAATLRHHLMVVLRRGIAKEASA
ncbi:MAG: TetR/AcrR family transcriptional regulator [Phycisphaerales bacterium]|nr:TetR/AcrR family transcriptional regulator [Phycisphaerales bacterium]